MSVNSIVHVWPGYEIFFVYPALYTELGTTRFCISPDGSYMFLTPKDEIQIYSQIYSEAIGAVGALEQRF